MFNLATGTSDFFTLKYPFKIYILLQGQTGGFNNDARDRDLPFVQKDEPATLPRVSELILITEISPWCTIVKNERGVTMSDLCTALWKESVVPTKLTRLIIYSLVLTGIPTIL